MAKFHERFATLRTLLGFSILLSIIVRILQCSCFAVVVDVGAAVVAV